MTNTPPIWTMTLADDLATEIRNLRVGAMLSQRELAAKTGLTQATISQLEAGTANPTITTLSRLALAFGAEIELSFRR